MNVYTKRKRNLRGMALFIIAIMIALSGCGKQTNVSDEPGSNGKEPAIDTTPVTLRVFLQQSLTDAEVKEIWAEPLKNKYPHISLEIQRPGKGVTIDSLIASGETPDIIYAFNGILPQYYLQDLLMDMTPLIKLHQIDQSRFDPAVMDSIKAVSKEGTLIALPFTYQFTALYYNKTLFDRFGIAYPKDGLFWDEAIELSKKLSRSENGVKYAGLDAETVSRVARPLAALKVDGKTDKASVNTDAWRKAFDLVRSVYTIPNNERPKGTNSYNRFMKEKSTAMLATVNILALGLEDAMKEGLEWDLAQYPSYREFPNVSTIVDSHIFSVTKTSKHKDQAMLALKVFTSDEVQLKSTRKTGRLTVLANEEIKKQLGKEMPFLQGKHLEGAYKGKIIASPVFSRFEFGANSTALEDAMYQYLDGKDINTTLRELEEKINNNIAGQK
ncbi:ABC transporter substrate-binding protein [Paenibacillus mesophilus]|uniref:ABC transporter substrate-binding protein n=1 Tax=Paenibacillus mesophilus TaxID=2582849 RepID=UPI0013054487|nr:extracellular solute-binding protein [Paenibacillus mesophilus]